MQDFPLEIDHFEKTTNTLSISFKWFKYQGIFIIDNKSDSFLYRLILSDGKQIKIHKRIIRTILLYLALDKNSIFKFLHAVLFINLNPTHMHAKFGDGCYYAHYIEDGVEHKVLSIPDLEFILSTKKTPKSLFYPKRQPHKMKKSIIILSKAKKSMYTSGRIKEPTPHFNSLLRSRPEKLHLKNITYRIYSSNYNTHILAYMKKDTYIIEINTAKDLLLSSRTNLDQYESKVQLSNYIRFELINGRRLFPIETSKFRRSLTFSGLASIFNKLTYYILDNYFTSQEELNQIVAVYYDAFIDLS